MLSKKNFTKHGKKRKFPTVGDLLKYIEEQKIPKDAMILVEQAGDYYFTKKGEWEHYISKNDWNGTTNLLAPVHNGFGWAWKGKKRKKRHLVLWQHY